MKPIASRLLPPRGLDRARRGYDWLRRLPQVPDAYLHPWRRRSRLELLQYRDRHTGERCFIIGNGPSLRRTDLRRLKGEFMFGTNRIYLLFDQLGFPITYYAAINDLVVEQCAADISALPMPKFIAWHANRYFPRMPRDMVFLYTTYTGSGFAYDLTRRIWEGATVTNVALQLAYYMGFRQVILVGVDHNFRTQGVPNQTVTSAGDDPDHFSADYFGRGFRWQLPDLTTSEVGYRMAREAYQRAGREVLDATIGGRLQVFPRVDYNALF